MKLYFELKKANKDSKEGTIRAVIMDSPQRVFINITKINSANWKSGWLTNSQANSSIRTTLNKYIEYFDEYINIAKSSGEILTPNDIKEHLISKFNLTKQPVKHTPITLIDSYINTKKGIKRDSSLKPFNTLKVHLQEYNPKLTFKQIDKGMVEGFIKYLNTKKNTSKQKKGTTGIQISTINKMIVAFKVVMKWGYEFKYHQNDYFYKIKQVKEVEQRIITLTKDELKVYMNANLALHLSKARDIFCFGAMTGLRLSDLKQVSKNNVTKGVLILNNVKTGNQIYHDLTDYCLSILEKYEGVLPFTISDQKINDNIKDGLKACGLDRNVAVNHQSVTELKTLYKPLYKAISLHSARRTFISLSVDGGLGVFEIMSKSGHKNIRSLQRYINVNQKDTDSKLKNIFNMD